MKIRCYRPSQPAQLLVVPIEAKLRHLGPGALGLELEVAPPVLAGVAGHLQLLVQEREIDVEVGVEGIRHEARAVVMQRHLVAALLFEEVREIEVGLDVAGIEPQTAIEVASRVVPLAGVMSSTLGLGSAIAYYIGISQLGVENEVWGTYIWTFSIGGVSISLWQEYALFFSLPMSLLGFGLGNLLSRGTVAPPELSQ